MKLLLLWSLAVLALTAGSALGSDGEYTLESEWPDYNPNDGFNDPGSWSNPWILREHGQSRYEIFTDWPDFTPGDGFMEAGTSLNPYRLRRRRGY